MLGWPIRRWTFRRRGRSSQKNGDARREACGFAQGEYGLPQRRACRLVGQWRSVQRYRPGPENDGPLREKLKLLAAERRRWGTAAFTRNSAGKAGGIT